jgi:hypothetical protein
MRAKTNVLMWVGLGLAGCGGGGGSGEPLIAGSATGSYKGEAFTATAGIAATSEEGVNLIALGDGNINCDSPSDNDPPSGNTGVVTGLTLEAGSYSNLFVNIYHNVGDFEGKGTGGGSVTLTAASATSVAGTVAWNYTDDEGQTYDLNGSFEVLRCE